MSTPLSHPAASHSADALESRVLEFGRQLLQHAGAGGHWWTRFTSEDALLEKLMADPKLRAAALRFVDVLPALRTNRDVTAHLDEYLHGMKLPIVGGLGRPLLRMSRGSVASALIAPLVRASAGRMARKFIAGDTVETARPRLQKLWHSGMGFTVDVLGEAIVSDAESEQYQQQYLKLLHEFDAIVRDWPANPLMDRISGRVSPRLNLSIKITALDSQIDALDPVRSGDRVKSRLRPIMLEARCRGAFITVDMEHYQVKDLTLRIFRELLSEPGLADWPDVGLAMQAYLRDTPADIATMIAWARKRPAPFMVRLVRGAYWDYETVIAQQRGWPVPVWTTKAETDICYEKCLRMLLEAHPHVETAVATHNARSLALAMAIAAERGLTPGDYETQMLYGMADEMKQRLVAAGQRLRVYVPVGQLLPGIAYLVRRLLENTASQSFLRMGMSDNIPVEQLMSAPQIVPSQTPPPRSPETGGQQSVGPILAGPRKSFENEPDRRFVSDAEQAAFAAALDRVRSQLGKHYPLIIGGAAVNTQASLTSTNPANPKQIIGTTASAGAAEVDRAVAAAAAAFPAWRDTPVEKRAAILRRAAQIMRDRRDELAAWTVYECAKPWREADGDIVEAIDFLDYYAAEAERLTAGHNLDVPGETNRYIYEPRGVGAVISPWNFPLAICAGMAAAPIAVGNTVIIKPAPQSPIIAAKFAEIMAEAGLPPGVLNYLPGGDEAGAALVKHPTVTFINFTGSRAVGLLINATAAQTPPNQPHVKHVIAEMGGKNAIIVDADADLDDAVLGAAASAFGYAGQKCSACSRIIVVGDAYESFVKRLVDATASLRIGPATDPGTAVPPVIDAAARKNILAAIEKGKSEAKCVLSVDVSKLGDGHYVGPTIFADVPPDSSLAQQEIFGPVVAVMRARDFDHALALANGTAYALTGGVYSRSPAHLDEARRRFRVGNLYLNRKITGAIVNRQPFGGMKMSGTDAKAGGPDYLLHFVEGRVVTENTIRRGFAPETSA